jgi:hypothetical protein
MAAKTSPATAVQWVKRVTGEPTRSDNAALQAVGASGRGGQAHMIAARAWLEQSHAAGSIAQATNHPAAAGGGL